MAADGNELAGEGRFPLGAALQRGAKWFERRWSATEREFLANNTWVFATSLAMIVCSALEISSAGVLLLIAVVYSTLTGGAKAGLASAVLASCFAAIYLSQPGRLLHYASADLWQLFSMVAASLGTVGLIWRLKIRERSAMRRLAQQVRTARAGASSERTFQKLADDVPVLLWLADDTGRRHYFNRQWLRFTGSTPAEEAGDGWRRNVHHDDLRNCLDRYALAVRTCENYEVEYRLLSADGEYRWMQDTGVPRMSEDGTLLGYIGCSTDRTERKRVETELHQLSARLLELQDDERRRIARELHDTTAQNLAVLSMHLCTLKEAARVLDARCQAALQEGLALAELCSQEIRTVSYLLHPPLLDELGLVSALRSYATGFTQRTGISVDLKIEDIGRLPVDLETTLFRIVQEALTNVHRHSGSPRAEVRMIRDPKEVKVAVMDEGAGIPSGKLRMLGEGASLGVGVAGMRERASQFGGHLKIASSGQGTTITAVLPFGGASH